MSISKTVIISCAGMGTRLGLESTKALIDICGEPLILRQLKMLDNVEDIRIVVGYQAERVIEVVNTYRKDIVFVLNHEYANTKTGDSVLMAAKYAKENIITLDGDLLVHEEDMQMILDMDGDFIGTCIPYTDDPVYVETKDMEQGQMALGFTREKSNEELLEWTGLVQINKNRLADSGGHVYQLIEGTLPLKTLEIRCREVDTPEDYERAIEWYKQIKREG